MVACGTRTLLGVTFGPFGTGETSYASDLFGCLRPGMVLLADRMFAVKDLVTQIAATSADLLIRCKNSRRLPRLATLDDGSWTSFLGGVPIRVIDAAITVPNKTNDCPRGPGDHRGREDSLKNRAEPARQITLQQRRQIPGSDPLSMTYSRKVTPALLGSSAMRISAWSIRLRWTSGPCG
ncbi:MAG: transposase family protein [Actinomycetia bacterium]|nr:transposase family protein [Actinomycetes bacterium]